MVLSVEKCSGGFLHRPAGLDYSGQAEPAAQRAENRCVKSSLLIYFRHEMGVIGGAGS